MTAPQPRPADEAPSSRSPRSSSLAVAGVGLWYLFFRPAGPAPVSLGSATPTQVASATAVAEATDDPATEPASAEPVASRRQRRPARHRRDLDGRPDGRLVQRLLGLVRGLPRPGELASASARPRPSAGRRTSPARSPSTARRSPPPSSPPTSRRSRATRTAATASSAARAWRPASSRRRRSSSPSRSSSASVPAEGATVEATAVGDLTLHGVTTVGRDPAPGAARGRRRRPSSARLPILFADYGMDTPQAMIVLSVEDNGIDGVPAPVHEGLTVSGGSHGRGA